MLIWIRTYHVYVGPRFGTVPVPALDVQFRKWNTHIPELAQCQYGVPSSGTGCPVPELVSTRFAIYSILDSFWNWAPSVEAPNQLSLIPILAPRQKKGQCRFGYVCVPVPELDIQCWNWNGTEMGSNIYTFKTTYITMLHMKYF
jgi:hypothetical protein